MPVNGQGTAVGQAPVTGGRERRYATDAERARAWRERQKARRTDTPEADAGHAVNPELAEAGLAVLLERLVEVGRAHEATVGELAGRIEDAIGALADPEAVAEALAARRAEAALAVAEAEERAVRAGQAKATAEAAARDATQACADAEAAANAAWERAETLEAEVAVLRQQLETVTGDAARDAQRHEEELGTIRALHAQQLAEQQRQADDTTGAVREAARVAVEEANGGRDRAEGMVSELRAELEAAKHSAEAALAAVRAEAAAARVELAEQLAGRYQAESEAGRARADAEIARAVAKADSAREIAENRAGEVQRLVAQVKDLQADLRRTRQRL